jgi:hypothetical protein
MRRLRKGCLLVAGLLALSGCATNSLFVPYPNQAQQWKTALATAPVTPAATQKL